MVRGVVALRHELLNSEETGNGKRDDSSQQSLLSDQSNHEITKD